MDKVICDMCGTTYAETAPQCPICGYARQEDAKIISEPDSEPSGNYSRVKGGRFSAANVRKINSERAGGFVDGEDSDEPEKNRSGLNLALGITAIVLFIMLLAVLISFALKIAENAGRYDSAGTTQGESEDNTGPCTSISVDSTDIELTASGDMWVIHVTTVPSNTTDVVEYSSSDPTVVSVDEDGRVTAVGSGDAVIKVSCGNQTQEITVSCTFESETTEDWSLNRQEFSLLTKGETWDVYSTSSKISKVHIQWTSDDETVATVDSGIVTAVGSGSTFIHAEYNGKKLSCKVLCKFEDEYDDQNQETEVDVSTLRVSDKDGDVTLIANGKSYEKTFELYLIDGNGNRVDVTWTPSKSDVVTIEGSKITGVKAGSVVVLKATYEGKTFECTVRVRNN